MTLAAGSLCIAVALLVPTGGASAGEWRLTPSFSVSEQFTDNATLDPDGGKPEYITTVSPGISLRGTGAKLRVGVNYALSRLIYANDRSRDQFRHTLVGSGNSELIDDLLFFDANASIGQSLISNRGARSATGVTDTENRTTVVSVSAGPSLRHQFGSFAKSNTSYRFGSVSSGSTALGDSITHSASSMMSSGQMFTALQWNLGANISWSDRQGTDRTDASWSTGGGFEYAVSRQLSLIGNAGYERVLDSTLTNEPNAPTWSVGFSARPGPRTSLRATYGRRFESQNISASGSFRITSRTSVSANYSESIQTSQALRRTDLDFIGTDEEGNLIDTRTGQPFDPNDPAFSLTDNAFRQKRFSLNLSGSRGRTSFGGGAFFEKRETDATSITERSTGGSLSANRQINRQTSASIGLTYRFNDFGTADNRKDHLFTGRAGLTYKISKSLSSSLTYFRTTRRSTERSGKVDENAVTVSVSASF